MNKTGGKTRFLALLSAALLVLGALPLTAAAAGTQHPGVVLSPSGLPADASSFYMEVSDKTISGSWNTVYKAADADEGVFLNGERRDIGIQIISWAGDSAGQCDAAYLKLDTAAATGNVVTLKGTFTSANAQFSEDSFTLAADTSFAWSGSSWVRVDDPAVALRPVQGLGDTVLYLDCGSTAIASTAIAEQLSYVPLDGNSGIWVNGERLDGGLVPGWDKVIYRKLPAAAVNGTRVELRGVFVSADASKADVNFAVTPVAFTYDGAAWVREPDATDVTFTLNGIAPTDSGFYVDSSDRNLPVGWSGVVMKPCDEESGIYKNGTRLNDAYFLAAWQGGVYISVGAYADGDVITVKGTFENKDTGTPYKLTVNELQVVYTAAEGKFLPYSGLTYEAVALRVSSVSDAQHLYLDCGNTAIASNALAWQLAYENRGGSGVTVNGETAAIGLIPAWDGVLCLTLPAAAEEGTVVTVGGTFRPQEGKESLTTVSFSVASCTFVYTGAAWAAVDGVATFDFAPNAPLSNGFYVTNSNTAMPTGWSETNFKPADETAGFWLNGEKLTNGCFVGDSAGLTYISLGTAPKKGDVIRLCGVYANTVAGHPYTVYVCAFTAQYNGSTWGVPVIESDTPGDANGDGAVDIRDLVCFRELLDAGTAQAQAKRLDLDGSGQADETDWSLLQQHLLGLYTIPDIPRYGADAGVWSFADITAQPTAAGLAAYKAAGFTAVYVGEDYTAMRDDAGNVTDAYLQQVLLAAQDFDILYRNFNTASPAAAAAYWDGITTQLNVSDRILGFYQYDEPTLAGIGDLLPLVSWQNTYAADKLFHGNLLPGYAPAASIGDSYAAYVQTYVDTILAQVNGPKTLCVDNYPLVQKTGLTGKKTNILRSGYLADLLTVANIAREYNRTAGITGPITTAFCIQAFAGSDVRAISTKADIAFQVNTALALGARGLEYFAYHSAADDGTGNSITGMLDADGNTTAAYEAVAAVNSELQRWDHVIAAFDWQGAALVAGSVSHDRSFSAGEAATLEALTGAAVTATADTVVGQFADAAGRTGYMAVNFTEPSAGTVDEVTVTLTDSRRALVYRNGAGQLVSLPDGVLVLELAAGEAAFVIPC